MFFLDFSVEFISKHSCTDCKKRIYNEMLRDRSFDIRGAEDENHRIVVTKKKDSILLINSFLPVVKIGLEEKDCGTKIAVNFLLRPAVKTILCIYIIVATVFEVCLINLYLQNNLVSPFLLSLPLLITLFALLLCHFGMRVMSMPIKNRLVCLLD